ncbi:MAG: formylmethanofuran dehydrogenase subunit B [Candidatus Methanophagaceae archaeon]|nr:MAG: formylmethanofuran dehydrogenase subunit B [Methanophagales archaeon]
MIYEDIICPVCGMACDDIRVELKEGEVITHNTCLMGDAKFQELISDHRIIEPTIDGDVVDWKDAIKRSADMLKDARRPLIYMGSETSIEAMKVGIDIADYLGGIVDNNASMCHGPTVLGIQQRGVPSCTIGQMKNRADTVVFWGTNPLESHPCHESKRSVFPMGFFRKRGRNDRKIIVADPRFTNTAKQADLYVKIKPGYDIPLFSAMRAMLRGHELNEFTEEVTGVDVETIKKLMDMLLDSEFIGAFIGLGLASSRGKDKNIYILLELIAELNAYTKCAVIANRGHCNVAGFNQVCTWRTGFPYAVDFSRGYGRYSPGEFSATDVLARKDVDAMLLCCADLGAHLPRKAVEHMVDIPLTTIDVAPCPSTMVSDVVLPGVLDSMENEGTFYRLDNIPLRARKFTDPPFDFTTSNEDTLKQIFEEIKK